MTNNYINKLSYMSSPIVQNKVLNGGGYYLLTNLSKLNNNYVNAHNNG
jgi:hypothetical protein